MGEAELAGQIGAFDALEARAHAQRLLAVARWTRRRRLAPVRRGDRIHHARAAVDLLGDTAPETAGAVLTRVLPSAEGMTAPVFRDRLRYHLYRFDAEAEERRRKEALARVGVRVRRFDEGVSELVGQGPCCAPAPP